jgi:hypothetical protein
LEPTSRSIFRPEAVRRHARSKEEPVLPRFVSPCTFLCLWLLFGLLGAATVAAWALRVPTYAALPAVIANIDSVGLESAGRAGPALVVFIPTTDVARVRPGQRLLVTLDGRQVERSIIALDASIRSPAALRQEFGLRGADGLAIPGPAATAEARLEPLSDGPDPAGYVGSVEQVQIEVGSVRLLSLLPLLSQVSGG